ncbi:hypothetical protein [Tropicimonas isoalkanivorans]|uniref:HEAT repeat domain-containing protein n=1 Tax=Tropicimonas isoalkanivorans TaxID=441112 RepID=A0A1I1KZM5_9RHOB|nr:hypothetical protein [Tropicimonas isoalkanivorans]SFC66191.1 hypothetical protein SAMN04488094_107153 [Tropicimonas isoalkanivorans]
MIFRVAAVLLLSLLAASASAENVRVLSGEHDNFSRLVMVFGRPIDWTERKTSGGYEVQFDRSDLSPDLSQVFDLIPKDRIQSVAFDQPSGTLLIESQCACSIEVFRAGANTVAIDITSDPQAASETAPQPDVLPFGLPPAVSAMAPMPERAPHLQQHDGGLPVGTRVTDQRRPDRLTIRNAMIQQLGRAASQGLAEMRLPTGKARPRQTLSLHGDPQAEARHMVTETVFDRVNFQGIGVSSPRSNGQSCLESTLLEPEQWAGAGANISDLAAARRDLLDQRDQPAKMTVGQMAQAYLSLGFGAEALAVVEEFPGLVDEAPLYRTIASLLDQGEPIGNSPFEDQESCEGASAAWAVLASRDPKSLENINETAVQNWFFRLPPLPRAQLGPALARNLLAAGADDAAAAVRDATRRAGEAKSSELVLLDATTDVAPSERDEAMETLNDVVAKNGEQSPRALSALLANAIHEGRIDPKQVELAEAMAGEVRGTEIGAHLLTQASIARAHLGDFPAALAHRRRLIADGVPPGPADELLSVIVDQMIVLEDDVALLRFVQDPSGDQRPDLLEPEVLYLAVRRLLDLGLPKLAGRLLKVDSDQNSPTHRHLAAGVALGNGDSSLALTLVAGETDPASLSIRAQALARLGEHAAAAEILEREGDIPAAGRQAWLSGTSGLIEKFGSDAERALWEVRKGAPDVQSPDPEAGAITLEQARTDIAHSQETRQRIAALIESSHLSQTVGE